MFEFVNIHLEHFQATLFIMLYKMVLTFEFVPQTQNPKACGVHVTVRAVPSCDAVC